MEVFINIANELIKYFALLIILCLLYWRINSTPKSFYYKEKKAVRTVSDLNWLVYTSGIAVGLFLPFVIVYGTETESILAEDGPIFYFLLLSSILIGLGIHYWAKVFATAKVYTPLSNYLNEGYEGSSTFGKRYKSFTTAIDLAYVLTGSYNDRTLQAESLSVYSKWRIFSFLLYSFFKRYLSSIVKSFVYAIVIVLLLVILRFLFTDYWNLALIGKNFPKPENLDDVFDRLMFITLCLVLIYLLLAFLKNSFVVVFMFFMKSFHFIREIVFSSPDYYYYRAKWFEKNNDYVKALSFYQIVLKKNRFPIVKKPGSTVKSDWITASEIEYDIERIKAKSS